MVTWKSTWRYVSSVSFQSFYSRWLLKCILFYYLNLWQELPLLSLRLQIQLQPYGIKLDTSKFEAMIQEDNDIGNVMRFCGDLLFHPDEDPDTLDRSKDDGSVDSELTFDFESFCRQMDEEAELKMSYADKVSMISVEGKYYLPLSFTLPNSFPSLFQTPFVLSLYHRQVLSRICGSSKGQEDDNNAKSQQEGATTQDNPAGSQEEAD